MTGFVGNETAYDRRCSERRRDAAAALCNRAFDPVEFNDSCNVKERE